MALKLIQGKQINVNLTGSFTGSFTGDGSGLTNLPVQNINTSSLATTGSNTFRGNQVISGSLNVTQGITGSLFGTSSWASNSLTASFVTGSNVFGPFGSNSIVSASFAVSSSRSVSSSFATTASFAQQAQNANFATTAGTSNTANEVLGYQEATVDQINVGELSNGKYAYVVRTEELEQSKHTTINIYNNLNFI